ncbi:vesicle transport protein SFT2B-like isoform X2 [Gambusia affinis]|uniref:vesicle transport protein SFT2B-like isoform X2 n=1 Tax=Gambusia affinis TaxID=33528 RepID=UPI001CDD1C2F|nr:vesicle transport protein SFT2B-like isoform X2 [Gambusia affinis]
MYTKIYRSETSSLLCPDMSDMNPYTWPGEILTTPLTDSQFYCIHPEVQTPCEISLPEEISCILRFIRIFKDPAMFQSIKDRQKDQKNITKLLQGLENDLKGLENDLKDKLKDCKPPKLKESSTNWGLKGFICCYFLGVGSIILGVYVSFLPHFETNLFIGLYAFGNIFALSSTLFLVGPAKQLKRMCDMSRVLATLTMLACVVLTPYAALWWNSFGFTMLFCALHILSFSWYSLSFTPCVRKMLKMFSLLKH